MVTNFHVLIQPDKMKNVLFPLMVFSMFLINGRVYSQKSVDFQKVYGSDPLLFNGKLYRFYAGLTKGTPFLFDKFNNGTITLRGQVYEDQSINFDIYNRQLVLQYISESGGINRIIVSEAWLESFEVNGSVFEPVELGDSVPVLCKVLKTDQLKLVYELRKEMIMDNTISSTRMQFSSPIRINYLASRDKLHRYTNNRTFVSFFDEQHKQELKKFLRKNRINVKKSGDQEMMSLLTYCSQLI
ncbi:MAG TPA: hypothetical protein VK212_07665 [Lentimicrobium sp.]|nr:hypothetical protein [Lentimicrobium sp.]